MNQKRITEYDIYDKYGALIRKNPGKKTIYLIFSADEYGEGLDQILNILSKRKVKASFFLTGNFLRNPDYTNRVKRMVSDKHFVGAHSDRHLLYMKWENRDSVMINHDEFVKDIEANYEELTKFGIKPGDSKAFLAPYEWYNSIINDWTRNLGLSLINFTPGTGTNADYTTPEMSNYKSSQKLFDDLIKFESTENNGLNGAVILFHPGTHPERTDKFYLRLSEIIEYLKKKGYSFNRF